MYRVLVTGSRRWEDPDVIVQALDAVWNEVSSMYELTVVHGNCPTGADRFASLWADKMAALGHPVHNERHDPQWHVHGNAAGPLRNSLMVNKGADVCLAFILDHSTGATDCAQKARAAGIPTTLFQRDPPVEGVPGSASSEAAESLAHVRRSIQVT